MTLEHPVISEIDPYASLGRFSQIVIFLNHVRGCKLQLFFVCLLITYTPIGIIYAYPIW